MGFVDMVSHVLMLQKWSITFRSQLIDDTYVLLLVALLLVAYILHGKDYPSGNQDEVSK